MTPSTMPTGRFSEAMDTLYTVRDCLRFAVTEFQHAKLFFGHGMDNAWDEAVYLTLHTLHLPLHQLEPYLDARLLSDERQRLLHLYQRRVEERVPVAYLTQEAWLGEYAFYVDPRVIVPRSFIAELLPEQLSPWIDNPEKAGRILDLCTGSGCLAILAALAFPTASVDAIDLSTEALDVARKNITHYQLTEQIHLIHSDGLNALKPVDRYDLIICNPPYVDAISVANLPEEYKKEPAMALGSGKDGLDFTRKLLAQAKQHLTEDGLLVVEIGHNRHALEHAFPELPFTWLETASGPDYVFLLSAQDLP